MTKLEQDLNLNRVVDVGSAWRAEAAESCEFTAKFTSKCTAKQKCPCHPVAGTGNDATTPFTLVFVRDCSSSLFVHRFAHLLQCCFILFCKITRPQLEVQSTSRFLLQALQTSAVNVPWYKRIPVESHRNGITISGKQGQSRV